MRSLRTRAGTPRKATAPWQPSLCPGRNVVSITERRQDALQLDSYGELKWKNVRRATSRNRAVAAVDVLLAHIATGVPVDGLTWNPRDSRPTDRQRIATWFVDTDYDGRTFCIFQAFFPDKSKWRKLACVLGGKGLIEPGASDALSGLRSLPFPRPAHLAAPWRIAVKVIDPRGNEGLRLFNEDEAR